jgi:nitronate monooxygenase
MNFGSGTDTKKAWKDIWGCGQGIGAVSDVLPTAALVARLAEEYEAAVARSVRAAEPFARARAVAP